MQLVKPTLSKLYLAFFLSFTVLVMQLFWGFFGIDIFATSFNYVYAPHNPLYYLAIILCSYLFACVATVQLPNFWQPTLLKILLALFVEFIVFAAFIFTLYTLSTPVSNPPFPAARPLFNPCPPGPQTPDCISLLHTVTGRIAILTGFLVVLFVAYSLSCTIVFFIRKLKKQQGKRKQ